MPPMTANGADMSRTSRNAGTRWENGNAFRLGVFYDGNRLPARCVLLVFFSPSMSLPVAILLSLCDASSLASAHPESIPFTTHILYFVFRAVVLLHLRIFCMTSSMNMISFCPYFDVIFPSPSPRYDGFHTPRLVRHISNRITLQISFFSNS
ncbi:hypothetical protein BDN70DRAFT_424365 [Pholiota conissans]|uniref:Uncharacterized protein n=1 Tax=Pholiota conissans TaxID=109636 RepID=A0A9P6CUT7_9AGAR|nr:hypothetical protein BDN70DRAFT_424365 [Pholiota conissans]